MTAVAVNSFDMDWMLKVVSVVTGSARPRSRTPKASAHSTSFASTMATASPGMPCSVMSSGILAWYRAITAADASSGAFGAAVMAFEEIDAVNASARTPAMPATRPSARRAAESFLRRLPSCGRSSVVPHHGSVALRANVVIERSGPACYVTG